MNARSNKQTPKTSENTSPDLPSRRYDLISQMKVSHDGPVQVFTFGAFIGHGQSEEGSFIQEVNVN